MPCGFNAWFQCTLVNNVEACSVIAEDKVVLRRQLRQAQKAVIASRRATAEQDLAQAAALGSGAISDWFVASYLAAGSEASAWLFL